MSAGAEICPVRTGAEIADATRLARAFVASIEERYPEKLAAIAGYLVAQDFEGKLAAFTKNFGPPAGECLIARAGGVSLGIVMMKRIDDRLCEMNRMYVDPEGRGRGIGRALGEGILAAARDAGYAEMRLDAWPRHDEALPLYRSLGFEPEADPPDHARSDPYFLCFRRML